MLQHPVMVNDLKRELIRPKPRAAHVLRHDFRNSGRGFAEAGVGEGVASGMPWVYIVAVPHDFAVELGLKIVDIDFPVRAILIDRLLSQNFISGRRR